MAKELSYNTGRGGGKGGYENLVNFEEKLNPLKPMTKLTPSLSLHDYPSLPEIKLQPLKVHAPKRIQIQHIYMEGLIWGGCRRCKLRMGGGGLNFYSDINF